MMIDTITLGAVASVALKVTLLLALAAIIDAFVLRRASAAARHQLWTFTVVGVLVLPALAWALPSWVPPTPRLEFIGDVAPDRSSRSARTPTSGPTRTSDLTRGVGASIIAAGSAPIAPASAPEVIETSSSISVAAVRAVPWVPLALAAYAVGVLALLARIVAGQRYLRRLARTAAPESSIEWTAPLAAIAARLGLRRHVELLRSAEPTMPVTWGVVRPFVMVPAASVDWPSGRREAVLVHELAHVARHDCLTQTLAAVACALYWPNPGIWWAARRLRVERELACDDRVVSGGIEARDYADHLLEIARTLRPPRPLSALAVGMATTSHIEMRLRAAIDRARRRSAPGRRATVMSAALGSLLLLPLSAFRSAAADAAPTISESGIASRWPEQRALGGTWSGRLTDPAEAGMQDRGPIVHISMFTPGLNTFDTPLSEFGGISADQMRVADTTAQFTLRRGPGTFTFTGTFRRGEGTGRFEFAPDSLFATELTRRGMQPPTAQQHFTLARHGVGLDMLDELAAQGYATPTTAALVHASSSGPELTELRALDSLGYRFSTLESVTRFHSSGITPEYIRELAAAGYRDVPAAQLIRARSQSVTAEFARRANTTAGRQLSIAELVSLRSRGDVSSFTEPTSRATTPTPATTPPVATPPTTTTTTVALESTPLAGTWKLAATGGSELRLDIDWDGNNEWARMIDAPQLRGLSPADAVGSAPTPVTFRLEHDAGVFEFQGSIASWRGSGRFRFEPNRAFATTLRSLGVQHTDSISDHDLKNMAFSGLSAKAVREVMAMGVTPLTHHDLADMAVRQVTPEYVRALVAAEVTDAKTAEGITELRFSGVTPAYVTELAALGYRRLAGDQIIDLWRNRVTPAFIRRMQDAGYRGATPEALIEMMKR